MAIILGICPSHLAHWIILPAGYQDLPWLHAAFARFSLTPGARGKLQTILQIIAVPCRLADYIKPRFGCQTVSPFNQKHFPQKGMPGPTHRPDRKEVLKSPG
jgi:hypothetical protein